MAVSIQNPFGSDNPGGTRGTQRRRKPKGFEMKEKVEAPKCLEVFLDNICQLPAGHRGKHRDTRDRWVAWTDSGAKRVLAESAQKQEKKAATIEV